MIVVRELVTRLPDTGAGNGEPRGPGPRLLALDDVILDGRMLIRVDPDPVPAVDLPLFVLVERLSGGPRPRGGRGGRAEHLLYRPVPAVPEQVSGGGAHDTFDVIGGQRVVPVQSCVDAVSRILRADTERTVERDREGQDGHLLSQ